MNQVKKGSKTLLYFIFNCLRLKNVSQTKDLIVLYPGHVQKRPKLSYIVLQYRRIALSPLRRTLVPHENDSSDKKKNSEKMTFNTQWLEEYNFVVV